LLRQRQYVAAEPMLVGRLVAGFVDAAIDAAAKMLDERAEHAPVQGIDDEIAVGNDAGLLQHNASLDQKLCRISLARRCMSASARSTGLAPVKAAAASSPTMNSMGDCRRTKRGRGSPICVIGAMSSRCGSCCHCGLSMICR